VIDTNPPVTTKRTIISHLLLN